MTNLDNIYLIILYLVLDLSANSLEEMKTIVNDFGLGLFNIPNGFGHTERMNGF